MKRLLKAIVPLLFLLAACTNQSQQNGDYAALMVDYVNHYSKMIDKDIAIIQKDLQLTPAQTENLYMIKKDLLAKLPDIRQMIFTIQMKSVETLEKEKVTQEDIRAILDELDIYNKILREPVVIRAIDIHSTMTAVQKEKLSHYLNGGKAMHYSVKMPPITLFLNNYFALQKELKLNKEQKKALVLCYTNIKKEYKLQKKPIKLAEKGIKVFLKEIILSDKVEIETIDQKIQQDTALFEGIITTSAADTAAFVNTLTVEQKKTLIRFISGFNFM